MKLWSWRQAASMTHHTEMVGISLVLEDMVKSLLVSSDSKGMKRVRIGIVYIYYKVVYDPGC